MDATLSTQELRRRLPNVLRGLRRGRRYTIVYRSQPIGEIAPVVRHNADAWRRALTLLAHIPERYLVRSRKSAVRLVREERKEAR